MRNRYFTLGLAAVTFLAACSSSATAEDYSDQTLTGMVTAVDGDEITIQLGTFTETQIDMSDSSAPAQPADTDRMETKSQDSQDESNADQTQPPEMPQGEMNSQTPPEKPESETASSDTTQPPEMPQGDMNGQTPPDLPEGGMSQPGSQAPQMSMTQIEFEEGDGTATFNIDQAKIEVESAQETSEGSTSDIEVDSLVTVKFGSDNKPEEITVMNQGGSMDQGGMMGQPGGGFGGSGEVTQGTTANLIDTDGTYTSEKYESSGDDENALRVDGAKVTLDKITVDKESGSSSNTEDGDFYGMNAALLATNGAQVVINNSTVKSSAQNGNGIFCYGQDTKVEINDTKITTTADNSGGIQTTGGGTTIAKNLTVETDGNSSAAIRSDRGGGTVNITGGTYTSNGYNSPAVYSTADITVSDADLTANNSEALVIEGKNSIALKNCTVSGNMSDDKGTSSDENVHAVMIYQSMSGDADVGTSSFTMEDGELICNNGDIFHFTNTAATMELKNVILTNHEESGILMSITGNDASHGWGKAGSNGAQVEFNAISQVLEGDILVDTISQLKMTLSDKSTFTGSIQLQENEASSQKNDDQIEVVIEKGSTWSLTGDSVISTLDNKGTIQFNGYTITLADGTVLSK